MLMQEKVKEEYIKQKKENERKDTSKGKRRENN